MDSTKWKEACISRSDQTVRTMNGKRSLRRRRCHRRHIKVTGSSKIKILNGAPSLLFTLHDQSHSSEGGAGGNEFAHLLTRRDAWPRESPRA